MTVFCKCTFFSRHPMKHFEKFENVEQRNREHIEIPPLKKKKI